jgi:ubiquinone/menaquinone biosynthesis C-methylase UbiE
VPPNVKFEIDDATSPWTWEENSIDFVHIRYLMGAIPDWYALFKEAYRVTSPGGYIQSCEADVSIYSDDGTADIPAAQTWNKLFSEGGAKSGRTFSVVTEDLQRKGLEAAGYKIIDVQNFKVGFFFCCRQRWRSRSEGFADETHGSSPSAGGQRTRSWQR